VTRDGSRRAVGLAARASLFLRVAVFRMHHARALGDAAILRRMRRRTFVFEGEKFPYFIHAYNTTWRNERAVEVAVARRFLELGRGPILEVGNVLSHYFPVDHDVVDKYEAAPRVSNVDVLEFEPDVRYGVIIAISTLEHVGFDEADTDPGKPRRALEHLTKLLAPEGSLFVTVPLGYNTSLDRDLFEGRLSFDKLRFMKRVSKDNRWRQVTVDEVREARYDAPYEKGNALAIGCTTAPRPGGLEEPRPGSADATP
jgi:hypothetical protein